MDAMHIKRIYTAFTLKRAMCTLKRVIYTLKRAIYIYNAYKADIHCIYIHIWLLYGSFLYMALLSVYVALLSVYMARLNVHVQHVCSAYTADIHWIYIAYVTRVHRALLSVYIWLF